jgi:hypothetical protein
MVNMRRFLPAIAAAALVLGLVAATTWAVPPLGSQLGKVVQLGGTQVSVRSPVCPTGVKPQNCLIVMTRATALQTLTNGNGFPTAVKQSGVLVGFTLGLAQLSSDPKTAAAFIKTLNSNYGGVTEAAITVLKPGPKSRWTVVAEGPIVHLQPYLGYVVQFPLASPIRVTKGEAIALSIPTWAPILSYNLPTKLYSYRQSREFNCTKPGVQQNAQLAVGQSTRYLCAYPGTRAEYSATELTDPVVPK